MNRWLGSILLALAACGAGDDVTDGTRGRCAEGGALNACADAPLTPEGACWRLVDCAAIPLHSPDDYIFDWGNCVGDIEGLSSTGQQLAEACIASSSCDQLKTGGSPDRPQRDGIRCYALGAGGGN